LVYSKMSNDAKTLRFLNSIGIHDSDSFDLVLASCIKSKYDKDLFIFSFIKETGWDYGTLERFLNGLSSITTYKYQITYSYNTNLKSDRLIALINDWFFNKAHTIAKFKVSYSLDRLDTFLTLIFDTKEEKAKFDTLYANELNDFFKMINYGFVIKTTSTDVKEESISEEVEDLSLKNNLTITEEDNSLDDSDSPKEEETNKDKEIKETKDFLFEEEKKKTEIEIINEQKDNFEKMKEERRQRELFKKGDYQEYKIAQIDSNSGAVDLNGRVFELDARETKTGKLLVKVGLDDGSEAIYVTFISNDKSLKKEDLLTIKVDDNLRVEGRVSIDKFKRNTIVMGHYFFILPPTPLREDTSIEKRIELHLHTNMSEMDGIPTIDKYCVLAKHWGHKALAVTDHGVVQSFPMAQDAGKKYGIKILYGCELYMIEDYLTGAINPLDMNLDKASYVVVDTESTGLSVKYDRIIEIGAVKIVNGFVTENFESLVNPEIEIPEKLQKITHISNEMVKDAPKFKDIITKFLEFAKGSILIAHNAQFDYWIINEEMINNGFGPLTLPCIDTLPIDRFLNESNSKHTLGSMCKRYEVNYENDEDDDEDVSFSENTNHKAHRADYDADVLAKCWLCIKPLLAEKLKGKNNLLDLEKLPLNIEILKHFGRQGYHVTVLAKNHEALRDLYMMISEAHINYLGVHPYVTRSNLIKYRKNLLVGSACANGELMDCALRKNKAALLKALDFYDYVEIQPLENYSFLINKGDINDLDELKKNLKDIIEAADSKNKIIVATGDCHYLNPEDKKYRDVLIESDGVGGTRHDLRHLQRLRKNESRNDSFYYYPNPDQHFRTTNEMLDCFKWLGEEKAKEYVITNTNKINDLIDDVKPIPDKLFAPSIDNCDKMLRDICYKKAHDWYGDPLPTYIEERLKKELDGIINNGYAVTYYISHRMVKMSNDQGYLIGSRGSVGSSFAATMAGITEVNPLKPHYRCPKCKHFEIYEGDDIRSGFDLPLKKCPICGEIMIGDGQDIPFETFLGFHADKVPDIDLNFPADFQPKAHLFTKELLGENYVFRAGTIGTVQDKTAFGYVKNYYKELSKNPSDAFIASTAKGCCEVKRTTGQHPGGIVVIPRGYDIYDFCPVQYPAGDTDATWKTTHFEFSSIHDTLLKFDMLGHVDPQAVKMMSELSGFSFAKIPMNDPKVLSLFTTDDALNLAHKYMPKDNGALGLPEFGTELTRETLRETKPKTFADLMIISGLTHGTNVWNGNQRELFSSGVMDLAHAIGCRDDIMVDLMRYNIAPQDAFNIMETVRKKDKHLNSDQIKLMIDHKVPDYYIEACKKIEYMFPKGHACAYVTMACRVGYYKVYYPLEFYATFFTLRCNAYDIETMSAGIDKIHDKIVELQNKKKANNPIDKFSNKDKDLLDTLLLCLEFCERGFTFSNIDINKSDAANFVIDREHNALIPPFKVLDGFGEAGGVSLINARKEKEFSSKEDLLKRGGISSTILKKLTSLHVLDNLKESEQISLFDFKF